VTDQERSSLITLVSERVTGRRLQHILRVEALAVELACFWNVSEDQACLAALLHDVARDTPETALVDMAQYADDPLTREMAATRARVVLHAPVGALLAHRDFGVTDPHVLRAIALHTTGDPEMDPLAMIIFLADYCESGRRFPGVKDVRALLHKNLVSAMALALKQMLAFLANEGWPVDEHTIRAERAFSAMLDPGRQP
jgi:predicted HD superfamily hydrolase involved in NAD metabolism